MPEVYQGSEALHSSSMCAINKTLAIQVLHRVEKIIFSRIVRKSSRKFSQLHVRGKLSIVTIAIECPSYPIQTIGESYDPFRIDKGQAN